MSKAKLESLLDQLIEQIEAELKYCKENEVPLPASDKAAILKLLRDNSVTVSPESADKLEALREQLANKTKARKKALAEADNVYRIGVT